MKALLDRLHAKLGDLWWYSLMIFVACRSGDVIQAFIGLWLVPKYVGTEELGAVLPLQQLSGLFAVPLAILATVFAKYVNTYATRGEYGKVKCFIRDVLLATCGVFLVCIGAAYLVIPHFYERLHVQAGMLTVLVLAAGFATNIASIFTAALQGLKMFRTMTVQNLISAPIRLVTLLVAMPFRALSGYILGQATPPASCSFLAALSLHKRLRAIPLDTTWRNDLPEIWRYLWPVGVYMVIGTVCSTVSTTVYRQRLPELESSAYYLLSRFAEVTGYLGLSVMTVMFPLAAERHESGQDTAGILKRALAGTTLVTVLLTAATCFLSNRILGLTTAWSTYRDFANLLPVLTLYVGISSVVSTICMYEMANKRFTIPFITQACFFCWTTFIVCFTGSGFFSGILPDDAVSWMANCRVARLSTLSYSYLVCVCVQLGLGSLVLWKNLASRKAV